MSNLGPQFQGEYAPTMGAPAGPVRDLTAEYHYPHPTAHQDMMDAYHHDRSNWEEQREYGEHMQMEDSDYKAHRTPPTLKSYLRGR